MVKRQNCVTWTHGLIVRIKMEDILEHVEKRFESSNYEADRPLPIGKIKNVLRLMKDKFEGKIITKFIGLCKKIQLFNDEDKEAKATKNCVVKET